MSEPVDEMVDRLRLETAARVPSVSVGAVPRYSLGSPVSGELQVAIGRHDYYPMDVLVITGSSTLFVVHADAAIQLADAIREADALWDRRPSEEGS